MCTSFHTRQDNNVKVLGIDSVKETHNNVYKLPHKDNNVKVLGIDSVKETHNNVYKLPHTPR